MQKQRYLSAVNFCLIKNKSYGYRVVSREAQGGLHLVIQLSFFEKKFLFGPPIMEVKIITSN